MDIREALDALEELVSNLGVDYEHDALKTLQHYVDNSVSSVVNCCECGKSTRIYRKHYHCQECFVKSMGEEVRGS